MPIIKEIIFFPDLALSIRQHFLCVLYLGMSSNVICFLLGWGVGGSFLFQQGCLLWRYIYINRVEEEKDCWLLQH